MLDSIICISPAFTTGAYLEVHLVTRTWISVMRRSDFAHFFVIPCSPCSPFSCFLYWNRHRSLRYVRNEKILQSEGNGDETVVDNMSDSSYELYIENT